MVSFKLGEALLEGGILGVEIIAGALIFDGRGVDRSAGFQVMEPDLPIAHGAESPQVALRHEVIVFVPCQAHTFMPIYSDQARHLEVPAEGVRKLHLPWGAAFRLE